MFLVKLADKRMCLDLAELQELMMWISQVPSTFDYLEHELI